MQISTTLGGFTFHLSFRKCKIILSKNADNFRAKLEWLYEVVLKYVGAYLILFLETIRNRTGRVLKFMEETYSFFLLKKEFFCFSLTARISFILVIFFWLEVKNNIWDYSKKTTKWLVPFVAGWTQKVGTELFISLYVINETLMKLIHVLLKRKCCVYDWFY